MELLNGCLIVPYLGSSCRLSSIRHGDDDFMTKAIGSIFTVQLRYPKKDYTFVEWAMEWMRETRFFGWRQDYLDYPDDPDAIFHYPPNEDPNQVILLIFRDMKQRFKDEGYQYDGEEDPEARKRDQQHLDNFNFLIDSLSMKKEQFQIFLSLILTPKAGSTFTYHFAASYFNPVQQQFTGIVAELSIQNLGSGKGWETQANYGYCDMAFDQEIYNKREGEIKEALKSINEYIEYID